MVTSHPVPTPVRLPLPEPVDVAPSDPARDPLREPRERRDWFRRFAHATAETTGRAQTFVVALLVILVWAVSGPVFHFSDTWQLVINTGTTIVTFLMVFLIQNTQNRDAHAVHLKLDELIRANRRARNALIDLEDLSDPELQRLQAEFEAMREHVVRARRENPKEH
jgi:low affinity Fe/Cu permease